MNIALTFISALLVLLLISCHVHGVQSQAYHFSKGWGAGKRSPTMRSQAQEDPPHVKLAPNLASAHYSSSYKNELSELMGKIKNYKSLRKQEECSINPVVHDIIEQIIQVEVLRLKSCHANWKNTRPQTNQFLRWLKTRQISGNGDSKIRLHGYRTAETE